ncbi:hypothetical protein BSL82_17335 [Tardibacter chloracetimidivorans]|uniref:Major facilitator superfamily (MFS) profile domain-containing protein n=2 Tax=Tardibacter chloracetimidivorans TaxID=1921510 RepID=A0A1L3ZYV9_9SPHN|nr:hypothetical protein BSL82_17335 [Tardibacter chloracetimidivorans]
MVNGSPMALRGSYVRLILQEWRQGWRPGLAAVIGYSLGYGFWVTISSIFVEPLQNEFGWSRGEIALANSAGLVTAFAAPLVGRLVDRVGVKPVLIVGLILISLSHVALSQLNGSLFYYYTAYFLLIAFSTTTSSMTFSRIIVGAFSRTRGTALALLRIGSALSYSAMPPLLYLVIGLFGSTGGFLMLAALNVFVSLPVIWWLVPGKTLPPKGDAGTIVQEVPKPWRLLVLEPKIIVLCLAAVLHIVPIVAIVSQLQPLGVSIGLSPAAAVGAVSTLGFANVIGALIAGAFVDRFWAPAVAFTMCVGPMIGCLVLVLLGNDVSVALFYVSVVLLGIGLGAEGDIIAFMVARYFGLRNYATIAGLVTLWTVIGIAIGSSLIGQVYDAFGNYRIALIAAAASFTCAGFAYLMMGKYPEEAISD